MGKGRTYELDMVRDLNAYLDTDAVFTSALDYSGGAADSDADIALMWMKGRESPCLDLVELKKRQGDDGNRVIVMGGSGTDETGRSELRRLVDAGPTFADSWLAVKFDHRALVVMPAAWVWEQVVDVDMPDDWKYQAVDFTPTQQRYIRRTRVPHRAKQPFDEGEVDMSVKDRSFGVNPTLDRLEPRLTDGGSLSMRKPSLDWWESSTAGEADHVVLCDELDINDGYIEGDD